jgi:hypothetical protein
MQACPTTGCCDLLAVARSPVPLGGGLPRYGCNRSSRWSASGLGLMRLPAKTLGFLSFLGFLASALALSRGIGASVESAMPSILARFALEPSAGDRSLPLCGRRVPAA